MAHDAQELNGEMGFQEANKTTNIKTSMLF
jgi:hypothetical protein